MCFEIIRSVGEGLVTLPASTGYVKAEVPVEYSENKMPEQLNIVYALAKVGDRLIAIIDDV